MAFALIGPYFCVIIVAAEFGVGMLLRLFRVCFLNGKGIKGD